MATLATVEGRAGPREGLARRIAEPSGRSRIFSLVARLRGAGGPVGAEGPEGRLALAFDRSAARDARLRAIVEIAAEALHAPTEDRRDALPPQTRLDHATRLAVALSAGRAVERPIRETLDLAVGAAAVHGAIDGRIVHVLSADESALRAGMELVPVFAAFGLQHVVLREGMARARRAAAYRAPILFARVHDVALDRTREAETASVPPLRSLRRTVGAVASGLTREQPPVHGALDFAIFLDAEDSLCRRSMTGIVATAEGARAPGFAEMHSDAIGIAAQFGPGRDFTVSRGRLSLTEAGRKRLLALCRSLGEAWDDPARAEIAVTLALEARECWQKARDYRLSEEIGVELLSGALAARQERAEAVAQTLTPRGAILAREGVDPDMTTVIRGRSTLRVTALAYPERAAVVKGLDRLSGELREIYGMRRGDVARRPDVMVRDLGSLDATLRDGVGTLVILAGARAEMVGSIIPALGIAPDLALASRLAPLAESFGLRFHRGFLVIPESAPGVDFGFLVADRVPPARIELVLLDLDDIPALPEESTARVIALMAGPGAGRSLAALPERLAAWLHGQGLPGGRAAGRWFWARRQAAAEAEATDLRNRLHEFDRRCRSAVTFLQTRDE